MSQLRRALNSHVAEGDIKSNYSSSTFSTLCKGEELSWWKILEMAGLSLHHRRCLCYLLFSTFIITDVYVSLTTVATMTGNNDWIHKNITDDEQNISDGNVMSKHERTNHHWNKSLPDKNLENHNEKSFPQSTTNTSIKTEESGSWPELTRKPNKDERNASLLDEEHQDGWEGPLTYVEKTHQLNPGHPLKSQNIISLDLFVELSGFILFLVLNITALVGLQKSKALFLIPWIIVYLISISASYINFSFLIITHMVSDGINSWKIFLPLATGMTFNLGWILVKSVFEDFKKQTQRSEQSERGQVGPDTTSNL